MAWSGGTNIDQVDSDGPCTLGSSQEYTRTTVTLKDGVILSTETLVIYSIYLKEKTHKKKSSSSAKSR